MPVNNFDWASQIKKAKEASNFKDLEPGTYNFEVIGAASKVFENSNDTNPKLNVKAKVLDGPRANHTQFILFDPFAMGEHSDFKAKMFLDFFVAVGHDPQQLISSNPSLDQIGANVVGRKFTAKAMESKQINKKTGKPYVNITDFGPLGASQPTPQGQGQGQGQGFGTPEATQPPSLGNTGGAPENPWS